MVRPSEVEPDNGIDAELAPPAPPNITNLARAYAVARARREEVSEQENQLRNIEASAEKELFDAMERMSQRAVRVDGLGMFSLNDIADGHVIDAARLREWAQHERPELLLPNYQTLGKIVRDAIKDEVPLPPGVEPVFRRKITWRGRP